VADPTCVFCKIVRGELPAFEVARTTHCTAFLDVRPLFVGHTLVVPNEHHETLVDLPSALLEPVFGLARAVASVMGAVTGAKGTFVAMNNIVSQSVPHLHVHPRTACAASSGPERDTPTTRPQRRWPKRCTKRWRGDPQAPAAMCATLAHGDRHAVIVTR
jgi:histidine triad (HIT) family protein